MARTGRTRACDEWLAGSRRERRRPAVVCATRLLAQRWFTGLKWTSFTHSCIYLSLLVCAFAAGKPEPATFVLGLTHGLL